MLNAKTLKRLSEAQAHLYRIEAAALNQAQAERHAADQGRVQLITCMNGSTSEDSAVLACGFGALRFATMRTVKIDRAIAAQTVTMETQRLLGRQLDRLLERRLLVERKEGYSRAVDDLTEQIGMLAQARAAQG